MRFRRASSLVVYWLKNQLVFENYALQSKMQAEPLTCSILHFCSEWRSLEEISALLGEFSEASILKSLNQLTEHGALQRSDQKLDSRQEAMASWENWNPAAGFFHFSTKDVKFTPDPMGAMQELQARTKDDPMPLPLKGYPTRRRHKLPLAKSHSEFPDVLKSRRTWRVFGKEAVELQKLAELLELTFGIQGWVEAPGLGRAAMKTSPSCGCLHPVEAYVLAQRVKGLTPGLYHYNAGSHELEWIRAGLQRQAIEKALGNQWWFAGSSFLVLLSAVFARTRWKYDFPRVYRGILLEAGHLCQTFCLTATWLGLAPFCTIAYADSQWEKWLRLDGVNESLLYIAGAGTRPQDMTDAHMGMLGKGKV